RSWGQLGPGGGGDGAGPYQGTTPAEFGVSASVRGEAETGCGRSRRGYARRHGRRPPPDRRGRGRGPEGRGRVAPTRLRRVAQARRREDRVGVSRPDLPADRPSARGVPPARPGGPPG